MGRFGDLRSWLPPPWQPMRDTLRCPARARGSPTPLTISGLNLEKVGFDPDSERVVGKPVAIIRGSVYTYYVDVSPDGEWLAFSMAAGASGPSPEIAVSRTDGSRLRQLTDDPYRDYCPRWSPDGSRIAFYSNRGDTFNLWSINPDGSDLRPLTEARDPGTLIPTWSRDGRMAYRTFENRSYIFDLAQPWTDQIPMELPPFGDERETFEVNSWSPDNRWLAGHTQPTYGIVIYDCAAQSYKRLPVVGGGNPFWLNDSRRLLFTDTDRARLVLVDRESGRFHEVLTLSPDGIHQGAAISPDNRWIYFSRGVSEADIWMLTLDEERE